MLDSETSDVQPITELSDFLDSAGPNSQILTDEWTSIGKLVSNLFVAGHFEFYHQSKALLHKLHRNNLTESDLDEIIAITRKIGETLLTRKKQLQSATQLHHSSFTQAGPTCFQNYPLVNTSIFTQFADIVLSMLAAKPFAVMYGPFRRQGLLHALRAKVPEYVHDLGSIALHGLMWKAAT